MLRSYLKIALRNLRKQKGYAFINIFGLAVGIAACLLIMLFVRHEWSYDRFHEKADRIYRAWGREDHGEGREFFYTITPIPMGPTLAETFPEVEAYVRVQEREDLVGREPNRLMERMHFVDPAFFDVFDFELLRGDPDAVLSGLNQVVLTPEVAGRHFPGQDPVGQTLAIDLGDETQDFVVTGIVEAPPAASSIQYEMLLPYAQTRQMYSERAQQSWFNISVETYVLLREGVTGPALEARLPEMMKQVLGSEYRPGFYTVGLQPITDIHLNQDFPTGIEPTSDPMYSYILGAIALLVLFIASINFVTLSIGQSTRRAREVGVRKAMGAPRRHVMQQFWGEAMLLTGIALLFGLALAQVLLPFFNDLSGRDLSLSFDAGTLLFLAGLLLVIGFGAGSYPALLLSGFSPIAVLKDQLQLAADRSVLRRTLVVVQFALSILMIISTLFIAEQLRYLQTKNLGFDKEQVVMVRTGMPAGEAMPVVERFRTALSSRDEITGVTASAYALDEGWLLAGYTDVDGVWREFRMNWMMPNYFETMGIELLAGRAFSPDFASDSARILVNEALVHAYGWGSPEAALGKRLPGNDFPEHEIVGVVKDFHFASLRTEVEPLVLTIDPNRILQGASDVSASASSRPKMAVRVRPDDLIATVDLLRDTWQDVAPDVPFDYYFLDEAVDAQYREEERLGRIASTASLLSVLIACLGLFGLATLTVARRTKEIGVRKVLGASAASIVMLVSKEFARLVVAAFVVAAPLAYLAMDRWLEDFAYRIDISWRIFLLAGMLALVLALATVSVQAIRAALADPVKALRYE